MLHRAGTTSSQGTETMLMEIAIPSKETITGLKETKMISRETITIFKGLQMRWWGMETSSLEQET